MTIDYTRSVDSARWWWSRRGLRRAARARDLRARRLDDALGREAELLLQLLQRRRGAEGVHADALAVRADVAAPSERRRLLHRDARGHRRRQHRVAILDGLPLEELETRHAHDASTHAVLRELLVRRDAERHLAAGAQEQDLGQSTRAVGEHVGAAREPGGWRVARAIERRQRLAAEHQHDGIV